MTDNPLADYERVLHEALNSARQISDAQFTLGMLAVIAKEELDVAEDRALGHYTHEKSPVACAAALAVIDYIENRKLADHARELGGHALQRLKEMKEKHGEKVIGIIEPVTKYIKKHDLKNIALIGSKATVNSLVFEQLLEMEINSKECANLIYQIENYQQLDLNYLSLLCLFQWCCLNNH